MDTKGLQKEFINWCKSKNKSPKSEDETKQLFVAFMKEKHPEEYKQAIQNQQKQQQAQAKKALHGAKLNYFKSLKNQCAEDEEIVYYKKGGSVGCGCKKKKDGGIVNKGPITKGNPSWKTNFENRNKKQEDPNANTTWDPKLGKRRKMTPEEIAKAAKNRVDAKQGKGEGTPERKCGGKVKKNEDGSKIKKNCSGAIAKFKAHRQGGKFQFAL